MEGARGIEGVGGIQVIELYKKKIKIHRLWEPNHTELVLS